MRFTVIIPCYNNTHLLVQCLSSLQISHLKPTEVIVVDDGSEEDLTAVCNQYSSAYFRLGDTPQGPAKARNLGVVKAQTDICIFLDSDVTIHAETFEHLLNALEHTDAVAAIGSYDDSPDIKDAVSQYANLRHYYYHQHLKKEPDTFWTGCGVVYKATFLEMGGFNESYKKPSVEDIEFGARLIKNGGKIRMVKNAQVKHLKKWGLFKLWRGDIVYRALPWALLFFTNDYRFTTLNVDLKEKVITVFAHLIWLFLLMAIFIQPAFAILSVLSFFTVTVLNYRFFYLLQKKSNTRIACCGILLHCCYYIYGSAIFAAVGIYSKVNKLGAQ